MTNTYAVNCPDESERDADSSTSLAQHFPGGAHALDFHVLWGLFLDPNRPLNPHDYSLPQSTNTVHLKQ